MAAQNGHRIAVLIPAFNEAGKIEHVVAAIPRNLVDHILVIDDGSTDASALRAREHGATVLTLEGRRGVGFALRTGLNELREKFDIIVIMAGNTKDDPAHIGRLIDPIVRDGYDMVIGSRFLPGGCYGGDMPRYRLLAVKLHAFLVRVSTGAQLTDTTNGFRAIRSETLNKNWLELNGDHDGYDFEVSFLLLLIRIGWKFREEPCSKIYPHRSLGYTKMRPFFDWLQLLAPFFTR